MCRHPTGKEVVCTNPAHMTCAKHQPKSYDIKRQRGYEEFYQVSDRNANGILGLRETRFVGGKPQLHEEYHTGRYHNPDMIDIYL